MGKWVVKTHTLCDGWLNIWTEDDGHGHLVPATFGTEALARAALQEHIEDCKAAYVRGDMMDVPSKRDYLVMEEAMNA